jgi:hypothetical protein
MSMTARSRVLCGLGLVLGASVVLVTVRIAGASRAPAPAQSQAHATGEPALEKAKVRNRPLKDIEGYGPASNAPPEDGPYRKIIRSTDQAEPAPLYVIPEREVGSDNLRVVETIRALELAGDAPEIVAVAAALAKALASDEGRLKAFIDLLRSVTDPELRRIGVVLLGRVPGSIAREALLDFAAPRNDASLRLLAIRSLVQNGQANAIGYDLTHARLQSFPSVHLTAAIALPLVEMLRRETDMRVFELMLSSLEGHQDAQVGTLSSEIDVTGSLLELMRAEPSQEKLRQYLFALNQSCSAEARDAIFEVVRDSRDAELVCAALTGLSGKPDTEATLRWKLDLALGGGSETIRIRAYGALATRRMSESDQRKCLALIDAALVRERAPGVRMAALSPLTGCGPIAKPILERVRDTDPDPMLRESAAALLEQRARTWR